MVEGEDTVRTSMSALAVLSCRPNSHPFQERHISLHEAVKIGRSVARARPSTSNGIFDCKVLSRHHALLWYEAGKFYLQDTKSSNGTFVNNQRLCKGGEESPAREIYSGDLIQFGVEVMESNRRGEKITHGCIISNITLYHPDGREAKPAPYLSGENQPGISLQTQDLYQLAQYLQEALHREKMLEQKLLRLQQLVHNTQEASESGWQALIDEDKLLSRLEMLENQLHIYSKNHSEDTLRQELQALQEDKNKYETTSKESLRRVLQEKIEAVTKLSDLEQSLSNMREECTHLKQACETSQGELAQLAIKYQEELKEVADLQEKLEVAEEYHQKETERAEQEKAEISYKLEQMAHQETTLSAKIESLQADSDFTKEQLSAMKAKLETVKEANEDDQKISENDLNASTTEEIDIDIIPLGPPKEDDVPENLQAKLKDLQKLIEVYKSKLETSDQKLKESNEKIEQLQKDLDVAVSNSKEYLIKIASYEVQLKESTKQSNSSNDWIETMKDHVQLMEKELMNQTPVNSVVNSTDSLDGSTTGLSNSLSSSVPPPPSSMSPPLPISSSTCHTENTSNRLNDSSSTSFPSFGVHGVPPDLISNTVVNGSSDDNIDVTDSHDDMLLHERLQRGEECGETESNITLMGSPPPSDLDQDEDLKALLEEARQAQQKAEVEIRRYRDEASETQKLLRQSTEEMVSLNSQLTEVQEDAKQKADLVDDLQDQLKNAESLNQDVKQQILELREQMASERTRLCEREKELEETKMQFATSQQNAKQNHNETEHLKEYQALKEECGNLRKRIQAIETEMKMSRKENLHLSSEYTKLQESYKHLESLKGKLETNQISGQGNLTDAQKDSQVLRQELEDAKQELVDLRSCCEEKADQIGSLQRQLAEMTQDYHTLQTKSRMVSLVSSIPLLMLLFALLMAVYPTLEALTSTFS